MLKFIVHIVKFLILGALLYVVFVVIWSEVDYDSFIQRNEWYELQEAGIDSLGYVNSYGHMFSRMREVKETKKVDLVFVGSSQAYRGFDTRIFARAGYSSFNLGSSNQTPLQSEVLLKQYLDQLDPEMVIYVVYPEVFAVDGVESTLDLLANDKLDLHLAMLALKQKNLKLLNTFIYAGYRQLFGLNKKFMEAKKKGNDTYVGAGYVEKELARYSYHSFEPNQWDFTEKQFKALGRTLALLKKKGIQYILVQPPTPKSFYESFTNNARFDSLMNSYGSYYNFNGLVELDDSLHFYDPYHMNQEGVELFDKAFIHQILLK